jgi:hypothetical protein
VSGLIDFERETAVSDWPLESETGVAQDDGFMQDETIAFGIADRPTLKDS